MNKKILIILGLVVIGLSTGLFYFLFLAKLKVIPPISTNQSANQPVEPAANNFNPTDCDVFASLEQKQTCLKLKNITNTRDLISQCQAYSQDQDLITECLQSLDAYNFQFALRQKIAEAKDGGICLKLLGQINQELCLVQVALNADDFVICDQIDSSEGKLNCRLKLISTANDFARCATLGDAKSITACQWRLVEANNSLIYCQGQTNVASQNRCLELFYTRQAMAQEDYAICNNIKTDEGKKYCLAQLPDDTDGDGLPDLRETNDYGTDLNKPDTDGDGLNDYDEINQYKTNPIIADTDGDTFSDGEEVASGHDPLQF